MKRELILIRHTKSSWADFGMKDFDRPLKKDRTGDAIRMGEKLHALKVVPDLVVCSPAVRTKQTAALLCDKLKYSYDKVHFDMRLYESSAQDYMEVIREIAADVHTLVVIGHNPSITYFANQFAAGQQIDDVATTGVVWLEFDNPDWELYRTTPCILKGYLTPKTI